MYITKFEFRKCISRIFLCKKHFEMNSLILSFAFLVYVSSAKLDHLQYLPPQDSQSIAAQHQSADESNFGQEPPLSKLSDTDPSFEQSVFQSTDSIRTHSYKIHPAHPSQNRLDKHPEISFYSPVIGFNHSSVDSPSFTPKLNLEQPNAYSTTELPASFSKKTGQRFPISSQSSKKSAIKDSEVPDTYSRYINQNSAQNPFLNPQPNSDEDSNKQNQQTDPNFAQNPFLNVNEQPQTSFTMFKAPNGLESDSSFNTNGDESPQYSSFMTLTTEPIPILRSVSNNNVDGTYQYAYETANNIAAFEQGDARFDGTKAEGYYSYISPEGKKIEVSYTADERGFLPQGEHIPTAPPVPKAILKALEYITKVEAEKRLRGEVLDDGQYRENYSSEARSNQVPHNIDEVLRNEEFGKGGQNDIQDEQRFDLFSGEETDEYDENNTSSHGQIDAKIPAANFSATRDSSSLPSLVKEFGNASFLPFNDPTVNQVNGDPANNDGSSSNHGRRTNRFMPQETEPREGYRY